MSLLRKLVLGVTLFVLLLLAGNLIVTVASARHYFAEQLQTVAEDAAVSLAVSLSDPVQNGDLAHINSMVDAIFDRGFYLSVVYHSLDDRVDVSRYRDTTVEGVPDWFIQRVAIQPPSGSADVVSGWYRLGKVYVTVHPGFAYRDLWEVCKQQIWLFCFAAVLFYLAAYIGVRYLLRHLRAVELQANAICEKDFKLQTDIPNTTELRNLVNAMNRMASKTSELYRQQVALSEALQLEVFVDAVTGLSNRKDFDAQFDAWLNSEKSGSPGVLLLIHIGGLSETNQQQGRATADELLKAVGKVLLASVNRSDEALVARRSGSDFCIFAPGVLSDEISQKMGELKHSLESVDVLPDGQVLKFWIGGSTSKVVKSAEAMLSAADSALRLARHSPLSDWAVYPVSDSADVVRPASEWKALLLRVIEEKTLILQYQPVVGVNQNVESHEVFASLRGAEGVVSAGVFWSLAERFDMVVDLDKQIIVKVLGLLAEHDDRFFSVNISLPSLRTPSFLDWLQAQLLENQQIATRLTLEIPEKALITDHALVLQLQTDLAAVSCRLALDHFGINPAVLGKLQGMHLSYLKIDRCFVHNLDRDRDNWLYLQTLLQITRAADVRILADGVESEAEWQALQKLQFDGGQGYLFGPPGPHFVV